MDYILSRHCLRSIFVQLKWKSNFISFYRYSHFNFFSLSHMTVLSHLFLRTRHCLQSRLSFDHLNIADSSVVFFNRIWSNLLIIGLFLLNVCLICYFLIMLVSHLLNMCHIRMKHLLTIILMNTSLMLIWCLVNLIFSIHSHILLIKLSIVRMMYLRSLTYILILVFRIHLLIMHHLILISW